MTEQAFKVIVVIMLCISNFQTFLIFCALTVIHKNTEWGRFVLPPQLQIFGGKDNENNQSESKDS